MRAPRTRRQPVVAVAVAVLLGALLGCSSTSTTPLDARPPMTVVPPPKAAQAPSADGEIVAHRWPLPGGLHGAIAVGSREIVLGTSVVGEDRPTRVDVLDPMTGRPRTLATVTLPAGEIGDIALVGDRVVYVELSVAMSGESARAQVSGGVLWRIHVLDPATGAHRVLASSGGGPPPHPRAW